MRGGGGQRQRRLGDGWFTAIDARIAAAMQSHEYVDDERRCDSCGEVIPPDQPGHWKLDSYQPERYLLCEECHQMYKRKDA